MSPAEFKAWFEGYCEAIGGKPTDAQWERIKEQVARLTSPAPAPIYRTPNQWLGVVPQGAV